MSDFDLDARAVRTAGSVQPQITSKSLCTPGCPTGALGCFTQNCDPTNGCTITK
ncbi:gallidermin/nisin family lantibiotic [Tsukamurella paurometabola]|uniref:Gallidermin/nisin family lantibiotic n=1 Tax=Tsukamurella paurometabola TaxID=2061 RepID=A0A3P8MD46_TSUPA|nr:gallidermin/nisin family lantibiotic [Tsukamurella paurometabola]MBS4103827.1 gallidermin/nisin family lantibiotic [Tsukamurella paurometabola]UEA81439.1 gallidermin/nisin family lantibiotic [Tsukamurella paurometabola]VDR38433.1 Lantibiotic subtilin precursor [Tsukamurella paurometabola]